MSETNDAAEKIAWNDMTIAIEAVRTAQTSTACRWWAELNAWGWPKDLEGKPDAWDTLPDRDTFTNRDKYTASKVLMEYIKSVTDERERLKWWHKRTTVKFTSQ